MSPPTRPMAVELRHKNPKVILPSIKQPLVYCSGSYINYKLIGSPFGHGVQCGWTETEENAWFFPQLGLQSCKLTWLAGKSSSSIGNASSKGSFSSQPCFTRGYVQWEIQVIHKFFINKILTWKHISLLSFLMKRFIHHNNHIPNSPITSGSNDFKQIPDSNHFDREKKRWDTSGSLSTPLWQEEVEVFFLLRVTLTLSDAHQLGNSTTCEIKKRSHMPNRCQEDIKLAKT